MLSSAVEDLRLPKIQLHENKHFKNCKFIGPAAIAIIGGNYVNTGFNDCGDVIALPAGNLLTTGIVALKNCTVDECEFIRTTILADQVTAKSFAGIPGASVKGLVGASAGMRTPGSIRGRRSRPTDAVGAAKR